MTTEAIEGNVEVAEVNVTPEVEATAPQAPEAADPELAEAERLLDAEAAQPQFADLPEEELLKDPRVHGLIQRQRQSAAQQAEDRLRKQMGSDEAVRSYVLKLKEVAEAGDDDAYVRAATAAIELNRRYQEDQVVDFFSNGLKELYKIPAEHHEQAVNALQNGDRAGYIKSMVDGAVASLMAENEAKVEAEVKARAARIIAAELKAAKIAAQPKLEAPPSSPSGTPAGTNGPITWESIEKNYKDSEWMSLPSEERVRLSQAANAAMLRR